MEKLIAVMEGLRRKAVWNGVLWLKGFREACCFHRVIFYCTKSRKVAVRTGQCFLLNVFIYVGSYFLLRSIITPLLLSILPSHCQQLSIDAKCGFEKVQKLYDLLRSLLLMLFNILWFYPLYWVKFVLSAIWYGDIASPALLVRGASLHPKDRSNSEETSEKTATTLGDRPDGLTGPIIDLCEIIYPIVLLFLVMIEGMLIGYVPYIGELAKFPLLSCMNAYFFFEFKWNHAKFDVKRRLEYFYSNWAFFAGFGCPSILATCLLSPRVGDALMAALFPLFVLVSIATGEDQLIDHHRTAWGDQDSTKFEVFSSVDFIVTWVLEKLIIPRLEGKSGHKIQ